jgi:hypothetical protein
MDELPVCGQIGSRRLDPPWDLGCGRSFDSVHDLYRCAQCDVPFHKACIQVHFIDGLPPHPPVTLGGPTNG